MAAELRAQPPVRIRFRDKPSSAAALMTFKYSSVKTYCPVHARFADRSGSAPAGGRQAKQLLNAVSNLRLV